MAGASEFRVQVTPTATDDLPPSYTECHHHEKDMYCVGPNGEDVYVETEEDAAHDDHGHDHDHDHEGEGEEGHQHCHFHAGVE